MRKKYIIFFCLFLTGCNANIACVKNEVTDAGKSNTKIVAKFKDNKLFETNFDYSLKLNNDYKNYDEVIYNFTKKELSKYESKKGITISVSNKQKVINSFINLKLNEMSKKDINTFKLRRKYSKRDLRNILEKKGYSCK